MVANTKILVVERDRVAGQRVRACLVAMGFEVFLVAEPTKEAILEAGRNQPVMIFLGDVSGCGGEALTALESIANRPGIPVISLPPGSGSDGKDIQGIEAIPRNSGEIFPPSDNHPASYLVEMESGAQEKKEWYRIIAELVPDPIFVVHRDLILEYANNAALSEFGERDAFVLGTPYQQVLTGSFIRSLDTPISRIIRWGGRIRRTDEIVVNGSKKWFDTTLIPLKDHGGMVGSVLVVCCDATARMETDDRLRDFDPIGMERHNGQILALNDEIRNPLQVIRSLVEYEGTDSREKIVDQIARIDSFIHTLDQGWLESEKVLKYLPGNHDRDSRIGRDQPHFTMGGTKGAYDLSR